MHNAVNWRFCNHWVSCFHVLQICLIVIESFDLIFELMFLSLQKREDDHGQYQVHEEELAHNDNHDAVSGAKDWYIGVHHVLKLTIPGVRIYDLIDR